jgi:hypothetical protein
MRFANIVIALVSSVLSIDLWNLSIALSHRLISFSIAIMRSADSN